MSEILGRLEGVIAKRRSERPGGSYVVSLLDGGATVAGSKVTEEAAELVEASLGADRVAVVHEAADLFFHALVLLEVAGVGLAEVEAELDRRFGTGGLAEKATRGEPT